MLCSEFVVFVFGSLAPSITLYNICTSVTSDDQRFYPTSPLKDYTSAPGRRRRSQSAGVRFKDASLKGEDVRNGDKLTINQCHLLLSCSVSKCPQEGTLHQNH